MTVIALQSPWPTAAGKAERPAHAFPVASTNALPAVATVQSLPDGATEGPHTEQRSVRDPARDNFTFRESADRRAATEDLNTPQPFPELRFADPLPNLPELDLPAKASAYQAALGVLRGDDTA